MTLLEKNGPGSNSLLSYYVCLQKGEVLYADGEFEFALMYFYRANQLKASQPTCLDGIRKATEILRCTICQKNVQLTVKNNHEDEQRQPTQRAELLPRVPIRRASATIDSPLTRYTEREANRLLIQVAKDRKLLIDLSKENQSSLGWTKREKEEKCDRNFHLGFNGLAKAQLEARGAIAIIESQLKFLDQAECLGVNPLNQRLDLNCSADFDRGTLLRMAEDELKYLQELSLKDKSMEVKMERERRFSLRLQILYRATKIVHCLQSFDSADLRARLMLAEAFRFIGQSYREIRLFDQSCDYFRRAFELIGELNEPSCLSRATFDFGQSLILKKNFFEAIELFRRASEETTNAHERTFLHLAISRCYLQMNEPEKAKLAAHQALDFALASTDDLLALDAENLLGEICRELKDFSRAEEYFRHVEQTKDRLGDLTPSDEIPTENQQNVARASPNFTWRMLTPYPNLFELCRSEKKKKSTRHGH